MAQINKPYNFIEDTVIDPTQVNANFDTIYNEFNGSISAANLASDRTAFNKVTGGFWSIDASGNLSGSGDILPVNDLTQALGDATHRWDVYADGINVNTLTTDLKPDLNQTRNLGSSSLRWLKVWAKDIDLTGDLLPAVNAVQALGSDTLRWDVFADGVNTTSLLLGTGGVTSDFFPDATASQRKNGTSSNRWAEVWAERHPFVPISEPAAPATDNVVLFVTATGTSPNREVALKAKFHTGAVQILASITY
ncbi:MAG TPA: hypothetical protein VF226_04815 [Hyphomicrobiaceae bacterium]